MKPISILGALVVLGATAVHLHGQAGDLYAFSNLVGDYNAISFGNAQLSTNSQDTEGPIAVGGNLSLGGDTLVIDSPFNNSPNPDLYVGGTFSIVNNQTVQLDNGYAALPGNAGTGTYPYLGDTNRYQPAGTTGYLLVNSNVADSHTDPRSNPIGTWASAPMSSVQSQLTTVSQNLATFSSTGSIAVSNQQLTFTGLASGITVFTLNASQLLQNNGSAYYGSVTSSNRYSSISINIPAGAFYIVNVVGAASDANPVFGPDVNFNSIAASQILWNFEGSGSVTIGNNGQFYGSILAPELNVSNGTNDVINGQLVANQIDYQNAELHDSMLVAIPEPPAWAAVMSAVAFAWAWRRRPASA